MSRDNNQEWYEMQKKKDFIKEKNIAHEVEIYFNKLVWGPILNLPFFIYLHLIHEFCANIVEKDKFSRNFVESYVREVGTWLCLEYIAQILGYANTRLDVKFKKHFMTPIGWKLNKLGNRFGIESEWGEK